MTEVLIHKQQLGNVVGISIFGGIVVILCVLALSSLRVFGIIVDAKGYAIAACFCALLGIALLIGFLLYFFFGNKGRKR